VHRLVFPFYAIRIAEGLSRHLFIWVLNIAYVFVHRSCINYRLGCVAELSILQRGQILVAHDVELI
jgi:hypothetical protein